MSAKLPYAGPKSGGRNVRGGNVTSILHIIDKCAVLRVRGSTDRVQVLSYWGAAGFDHHVV